MKPYLHLLALVAVALTTSDRAPICETRSDGQTSFETRADGQSSFPLSRAWTVRLRMMGNPVVDTRNVYFDSWSALIENNFRGVEALVCIDSETGRTLWSQEVSWPNGANTRGHLTKDGDHLYLSCGRGFDKEADTVLKIFEASSGALIDTVEVPGKILVACDDGVVTSVDNQPLALKSLPELKTIWTLKGKGSSSFVQMHKVGGLFLMEGDDLAAIDIKSGKVLWETAQLEPASIAFDGDSILMVAPDRDGLECRDLRTHALKWKNASDEWQSGYLDADTAWGILQSTKLVGNEGIFTNYLCRLDPQTGSILWKQELVQPNGTGVGSVRHVGNVVVANTELPTAFSIDGAFLWQWPKMDETFFPEGFSNGTFIVEADGGVMGYRETTSSTIASADRAKLANDLASRFSQLDSLERDRLSELGVDGFNAILPIANELAKGAKDSNSDPRFYYAMTILARTVNESTAPVLVNAIETWGTPSERNVAPIIAANSLSEFADPKLFSAFFRHMVLDWDWKHPELQSIPPMSIGWVGPSIGGWVRSGDPDGFDYAMAMLNDPSVDEGFKSIIYTSLASSDDPRAINELLVMRHKREPLPPMIDRLNPDGASKDFMHPDRFRIVANQADLNGDSWFLVTSDVLGDYEDLWLVKQVKGVWQAPIFTNLTNSDPNQSYVIAGPPPETTFKNQSGFEILKGGKWFETLVGAPDLLRDSDGDGLTDREEGRLGINPSEKDTDGDGMSDALDPCPNAPDREVSEEEEVIQAGFEARYHFHDRFSVGAQQTPAEIVLQPDMQPMEFYGWPGPLLVVKEALDERGEIDKNRPLLNHQQRGVIEISFQHIDSSPQGSSGHQIANEADIVTWGSDRTTATMQITTWANMHGFDTYEIHLRKIGTEWFATKLEMIQSYP